MVTCGKTLVTIYPHQSFVPLPICKCFLLFPTQQHQQMDTFLVVCGLRRPTRNIRIGLLCTLLMETVAVIPPNYQVYCELQLYIHDFYNYIFATKKARFYKKNFIFTRSFFSNWCSLITNLVIRNCVTVKVGK